MDKACLEIRDLLDLGVDLAPNERIAIESHVSICEDCARELEESRTLAGNLAILREGEMPAGAAERIWRGVQSAVPGNRRSAILQWSVRAAAILVIGLSIGYSSRSVARSPVAVPPVEDVIDEPPFTLVSKPVHAGFGAPDAPLQVPMMQVLPSSTWHYLAPVEEILESDQVRF
jgi:anti-sigma factor RsiW